MSSKKYKIYSSKEDIYQDYQIAIKFVTRECCSSRSYDKIRETMMQQLNAKSKALPERIKGFRGDSSISWGYYIEIPVKGDTGKKIGSRFILLYHETGLELFIPGLIIGAISKVIVDSFIDESFKKFIDLVKEYSNRLTNRDLRIDHIEIRTENKGTATIPWRDFQVEQIDCLVDNFDRYQKLYDFNNLCFQGKLASRNVL